MKMQNGNRVQVCKRAVQQPISKDVYVFIQ